MAQATVAKGIEVLRNRGAGMFGFELVSAERETVAFVSEADGTMLLKAERVNMVELMDALNVVRLLMSQEAK